MTTVYAVLPAGIDDPRHPSGGNVYDRRVLTGLAALGWSVIERPVPGAWPDPDAVAVAALSADLDLLPDGAVVLIDGLIASAAPRVVVPQTRRLRVVVLLHMLFGGDRVGSRPDSPRPDSAGERAVLDTAAAVIVTSRWTRRQVLDHYRVPASAVHVAEPGVSVMKRVSGSASGGELLCVGVLAPHKGQDVLLDALGLLQDLDWRCLLVGALDRDPAFVHRLRSRASQFADRVELAGRVDLTGPLVGEGLDNAYAAADLLLVPSLAEAYGMVVAEALARGLPVIASDVGGLPGTLGVGPDGRRPGLLVPPGDPVALAAALRGWLTDADLRTDWRAAAGRRREQLADWTFTAGRIAGVLAGLPSPGGLLPTPGEPLPMPGEPLPGEPLPTPGGQPVATASGAGDG